MGSLSFFEEDVPIEGEGTCAVEVIDAHGVPEVRVGPPGAADLGAIARFDDWSQFERFFDAASSLRNRLGGVK